MILEPRQRLLIQTVFREGRLSRSAMHERTGMRLNTVGEETAALLARRILREGDVQAAGRGRPRVPVEIDPNSRHVLGLAIYPGRAEIGPINLLGEPMEEPAVTKGKVSASVIQTAADMLAQRITRDTLAIGLTIPGIIEPHAHRMLFSSAVPGGQTASIQPIYTAAGHLPIAFENDAHALAAHWALMHPECQSQDMLLVFMSDGQLGASLLVDGKPNRGCVHGANELGHTRMPIATPICYCGHQGCLERICSSEFLAQHDQNKEQGHTANLVERADAYAADTDDALEHVLDLLSLGLANMVNFTRVPRLVLVSELGDNADFHRALTERIERQTLKQLAKCLTIDLWQREATKASQTAGSLVLAHLYCEGWQSPLAVNGKVQPAA